MSSGFQKEIIINSKDCKIGKEYDGVFLWDYTKRRVKPSTKVEASNLKIKIKKSDLRDFNNDVVK